MPLLKDKFESIESKFKAEKLKYFIENIYERDHKPSYYVFHKTVDWIVEELKSYGIQAKKVEVPADGKTIIGDWKSPLAWDAFDLKLKDLQSDEVIADYQKVSTHMVMGAGPTPKEGLKGSAVYLKSPNDFDKIDVRDKFIITEFIPSTIKKAASEQGALGFLFYGPLEDFQGDLVRWVNSWADDSGLWSMTEDDTVIPAVSLSPNTIKGYIKKLKNNEDVSFELKLDTKFYEGTLPLVEAFIPGKEKDEVFFTGHLFEQGANDNASGCATMMEIARIFSESQPKRGMRFLFTSELYGTVPYSFLNLDIMNRSKIGLNIDSTCEVGRQTGKMDLILNPDTNPSYVNLLLKEILIDIGKEDEFSFNKFLLDDNMITDTQINIPCALVGVCSFNWHTSADTLDIIDWDLFNKTTILCATWAEVAVNGGEEEALRMQSSVDKHLTHLKEKFDQKEIPLHFSNFKEEYFHELSQQYRESVNQLYPVNKTEKLTYEEKGPLRNHFGPPSFGLIRPSERCGSGMWGGPGLQVLWNTNGKRSKDRIMAYTFFTTNHNKAQTQPTINNLYKQNYLSDSLTNSSLLIELKRIGIKPNDMIIVHGSMKQLGRPVHGGPETIITALLEAVGPEGTLIIPTFVHHEKPTDLRTKPSRLGLISETFRKWPGVIRSNNPTHCVSAIGKRAVEVIEGHEKTTQLGIDSPLHKAAKLGAKILHLGTNFSSCSLIHVAEVIAEVPFLHIGYPGYEGDADYIDSTGTQRSFTSKQQPADSQGFKKLMNIEEVKNIITECNIADASSILIDAKELLDQAVKFIKNNPFDILCENPKCPVCTKSREVKQN